MVNAPIIEVKPYNPADPDHWRAWYVDGVFVCWHGTSAFKCRELAQYSINVDGDYGKALLLDMVADEIDKRKDRKS